MTRFLARLRALWRGLFRGRQLDADMDDEIRFHIEMQAGRLMRERQLDEAEARRLAHVAFGGVEKFKEEGRDTRGVQWLDAVALDARLGLRMLGKHPSLTVIGTFAMAVAIAIGAATFEVISEALDPALPIEHGERVVSIQYDTDRPGNPERPRLHDFVEWRDGLDSIQHLGAFRTVEHNLATATRYPEPVRVAEITASAFTLTRTPPQLGRYLLPDDEREGAARVVVIGHREWQTRFAGDPAIVGSTVTLNTVPHTVIGVMPAGFAFPIDHQFWAPLVENPSRYDRLNAPSLEVFGLLAQGVTIAAAQAQLATIHEPLAARHPETYGRWRAAVLPYTLEHVDVDRPVLVWALRILQLLISGLLVVVAVNLAILFYARAVTRRGEIAVRSALGASRARILAQLFMEALTLSVLGAGVGLVLADAALAWLQQMVSAVENIPFWITFDLSATTVTYAVALAVLAALIVGVLPGLKTTGVGLEGHLRALTGAASLRVGRMWTSLVVAQVAIAVAILPFAIYTVSEVVRMELSEPGFAAERLVIAKVERFNPLLVSRLEAEPLVSAVTLTESVPGYEGSRFLTFEDPTLAAGIGSEEVNVHEVAIDTFDVYGANILAGRRFTAGEVGAAGAVIVNRSFERELLPGRSPLGLRFSFARRSSAPPGAPPVSYQIVGVVEDFPSFPPAPGSDGRPTVYHPVAKERMQFAVLTVRFNGRVPADFAGRLRQIGAEVDAAMPLRDVMLLADFYARNRSFWRLLSWALALITSSVLLLSAAGIYALMSFTVAQRTREVGIRTALGAHPRRIVAGIFGRVLAQLGLGLLVGSLVSAVFISSLDLSAGRMIGLLLSVGAVIAVVAMGAAVGPARRSLRIQAIEALRTDG